MAKRGACEGAGENRGDLAPRYLPVAIVSLALQMTNRARAAYNQVRDRSKHRLRRAISRLERDSVLLHSNQATSASTSERTNERASERVNVAAVADTPINCTL